MSVGEVQHRSALGRAHAGDAASVVHHTGRQAGGQGMVQQGPGGEPAGVLPLHRSVVGRAVAADLGDGLEAELDVLVLRDVQAVQDIQGGVLQGQHPAGQRGDVGGGLVDGDVLEAGLQQQQRRHRPGRRPADDGDAGLPHAHQGPGGRGKARGGGRVSGRLGAVMPVAHQGLPSVNGWEPGRGLVGRARAVRGCALWC
jgi:hypothetical protein